MTIQMYFLTFLLLFKQNCLWSLHVIMVLWKIQLSSTSLKPSGHHLTIRKNPDFIATHTNNLCASKNAKTPKNSMSVQSPSIKILEVLGAFEILENWWWTWQPCCLKFTQAVLVLVAAFILYSIDVMAFMKLAWFVLLPEGVCFIVELSTD